jgi:hypothetical protein
MRNVSNDIHRYTIKANIRDISAFMAVNSPTTHTFPLKDKRANESPDDDANDDESIVVNGKQQYPVRQS